MRDQKDMFNRKSNTEREREKKKKEMFDNLISTAYKKARLPNTPYHII